MRGSLAVRLVQCAVATVALVAVAGLGVHLLDRPGVYLARTYVIIYPPAMERANNPLDGRISAAVNFTGLAARRVGGMGHTKVSVSSNITLLDQNIRRGWVVRQPSSGGQWDYIFDQPTIEVQATGASPEEVLARVEDLVGRVQEEVVTSQEVLGVSAGNRMRTLRSPIEPQLIYAEGSRPRALIALAGVALLVAGAAYSLSGRLMRVHVSRRSRHVSPTSRVDGLVRHGR